MTFRRRLMVGSAAAVAVAVALASIVTFVLARAELRGEVASALRDRVSQLLTPRHAYITADAGGIHIVVPPPDIPGEPGGYVQLVGADGSVYRPGSEAGPVLRVTTDDRLIATGRRPDSLTDVRLGGVHYRLLTARVPSVFSLPQPLALQVARPLVEVDATLHRLALILLGVFAGGVTAAAGLGFLVSRTAARPVRQLTEAAEHVTATGDLGSRIDAEGDDEVGRLATSFNAMLDALERSMAAQRRLVADASHELRTPLTSLRTNIEVLARESALSAEDRERLRADVVAQLEEMSALVSDVVELARDGAAAPDLAEDVRVEELVLAAVDRARRLFPRVAFSADVVPAVVVGPAALLDRAVGNLLDNAAKWSTEVEVGVRREGASVAVTVRDHGPGIAAEDLPHVFDRFYRSPRARGTPGSGLGLAIVRHVAEVVGGSVTAGEAFGGGALLTLRLPAATSPAPPPPVPTTAP
jgi:two-component system, OmpR family, sensor histidine kinase MprB